MRAPAAALVWFAIITVSCGSAATEALDQLCDLADQVDAVYEGVEGERAFTPEERAKVESLVNEMQPFVPSELDATFRLRYWPNTSVIGLDTSGVAAQAAYDEWRAYRNANC